MTIQRFFIAFLLSSFLFVGQAKAFLPLLLPLSAAAARSYAPSFFARSVVAMNLSIATIRGVGSKVLNLDTRVAGMALLAGSMGYSDFLSPATRWYQKYYSSYWVANASAPADVFLTSNCVVGDKMRTFRARYASPTQKVVSYVDYLCISDTSQPSVTVLAVDSLISDLNSNPTQSLTDSLVYNLSSLSVVDPVAFDSMVTVSDVGQTQLSKDYPSGDSVQVKTGGEYVVNGVVQNSASFVGKDGLRHFLTLDSSGYTLVDGQPSNGFTASLLASSAYASALNASSAASTAANAASISSLQSKAAVAASVASSAAANSTANPSSVPLASAAAAAAASSVAADAAVSSAQASKAAKAAADAARASEIATTKTAAAGIAPVVGGFLNGVTSGGAPPAIILHGSDGSVMFESNLTSEVAATGIPAYFVTLLGFMGLFAGLAFTLMEIL